MCNFFRLLLVVLLGVGTNSWTLAAEMRYAARFADGSRHEGNNLVNWHDNNAQPQLEGRSLLDAGNPFRWLRDRTLSPTAEPAAYIETITGDRLTGSVTSYVAASDPADSLPPYFVIEPGSALRPQPEPNRTSIRVVAACVRKIVWQRRENARYQPNTLLLRDGRTLSFRVIRFDDGFASVRTSEGNKQVSYGEIAEAHLSPVDFWQQYFDELAILSPQCTSRLYQLETTDGLLVTGSKERMAVQPGNPQDVKSWVHGLQPAWSLDVLWIPNERVWMRRSFAPHEVPLSRITPSEVKYHATLGKGGEPWRRDRNIAGEPVRSAGKEWGFGLGVTTTSDLIFKLPPGAKSLRGSVGLDRLAGKGGCVKLEVAAGAKEPQKLWESPVLQSSETAIDFGPLPFAAPQEIQTLALHADAVQQGRPVGADPFEVRDFVDWLDPIVEFDPAIVLKEVRSRIPVTVPAWAHWHVNLAPVASDKAAKLESFESDQLLPRPGRFRSGVVLEQPIVLSRRMTLTPQDQWLLVYLTRAKNQGTEPRLEARIGGELVAEFKVPFYQPQVRPLAIPLLGYHGSKQELDLQLTLYAEPNAGPIEWRAIRTVSQLPTLYRVFEEESNFNAVTGVPPTYEPGDGAFGVKSLKLNAGSSARIEFERPLRIRQNPQQGEFSQLRLSVFKKGKGHVLVEFEGTDAAPPRTLRFGSTPTPMPDQVNAFNDALPESWLPLVRDLYTDFGTFDATALTLRVPDGEYALFDHVYIANRSEDFAPDLLARTPTTESIVRRVDQAAADELLQFAKPFVALIDFGEGRLGSGVVTGGTGELLTAGHLLIAPNREVTITLADGKQLKAKTRGINREFDVGLVKVEPDTPLPSLPVNHWVDLSTQTYYGAMVFRQGATPTEAEGQIVDLRRLFKGTAWTTLQFPPRNGSTAVLCGGALVNKEKQLVGVLTRNSPFGGAEFASTQKLNEYEGRLRAGEVWGKWRDGTGPALGFMAEPSANGLIVKSLDAGGPAAAAGVQIGDLLTKIDGRPMHGVDDLFAAVAERDPGYEATVELMRSAQPITLKIKLAPRSP